MVTQHRKAPCSRILFWRGAIYCPSLICNAGSVVAAVKNTSQKKSYSEMNRRDSRIHGPSPSAGFMSKGIMRVVKKWFVQMLFLFGRWKLWFVRWFASWDAFDPLNWWLFYFFIVIFIKICIEETLLYLLSLGSVCCYKEWRIIPIR